MRRLPRAFDGSLIALAIVMGATALMRIFVNPSRPLWLDEVQTGALVGQPNLAAFAHQLAQDVNAPLYFLLAAPWAGAFGLSDAALRSLPTLFSLAAPLAALIPSKAIDRPTRLIWAALIACWIPGIWYAQEARPYTLALLFAVVQAIAFAAVIAEPRGRRAWAYTAASGLLVLSHYFGAVLIAVQGVILLLIHRRRVLGLWPLALGLIPAAWLVATQWRGLVSFVHPGTSWIQLAGPGAIPLSVGFLFGVPIVLVACAVWLAAVGAITFRRPRVAPPAPGRLWLIPLAAMLAVALVVAAGFFVPVLVERYLTVFVPGVLLGLALVARRATGAWRLAPAALVAIFFTAAVQWALGPHRYENALNWERASDYLMASQPKTLVFLWDTPMRPSLDTLAGLGGFFFARAGRPVVVDAIQLDHGQDPNPLLVERGRAPGSAILWVYDLKVPGTAAIRFWPRISRLDSTWRCRNFGNRRFGIFTCDRR